MQDDPGVWQRDVGDGDDDLRVAHVVLPAAVGHVVDPLPVALPDEPLVLARVAVVAPGVVAIAAVQAPRHPPVAFDLIS